jgi:integrase/recombinase XerD
VSTTTTSLKEPGSRSGSSPHRRAAWNAPPKRTEHNLVTYLTEPEVDALLDPCDQSTWTGCRDHAMLALTIQTGLRISELAALTHQDLTLTAGANVHTVGKAARNDEHR